MALFLLFFSLISLSDNQPHDELLYQINERRTDPKGFFQINNDVLEESNPVYCEMQYYFESQTAFIGREILDQFAYIYLSSPEAAPKQIETEGFLIYAKMPFIKGKPIIEQLSFIYVKLHDPDVIDIGYSIEKNIIVICFLQKFGNSSDWTSFKMLYPLDSVALTQVQIDSCKIEDPELSYIENGILSEINIMRHFPQYQSYALSSYLGLQNKLYPKGQILNMLEAVFTLKHMKPKPIFESIKCLNDAADTHTDKIIEFSQYSHYAGGTTLAKRILDQCWVRCSSLSEVICYGNESDPIIEIIKPLLISKAHRKIILDDFSHAGISVASWHNSMVYSINFADCDL